MCRLGSRLSLAHPHLLLLAVLLLVFALAGDTAAHATDDHLLLCEGVLTPTAGEYLEIVNTTDSPLALDDYYLSDDEDYALLPGASGAGPAPAISAFDFIVQFPADTVLAPCGVVVVALDGTAYLGEYLVRADFEILGTDPGTPDMIATDVGSSAGLTNGGEAAILFSWDGASDLVEDVDMVHLGMPSTSNDIGSKTGLAVDGPDADAVTTAYQADAGTMPLQDDTPGDGESAKRAMLEGIAELSGGGNGLTGDDETSEDILVTWDSAYSFTAPDPGRCGIVPRCYYKDIDTTDADTLRDSLHQLIAGHRRFPYSADPGTDSWDILELADENPDDPTHTTILDVYRNAAYPKAGGGNPDYQREHSWPSSFGFPDESDIPYTDCHHLFLADGDYNNARSNHPYRACDDPGCVEYPTLVNHGQGGPGHSSWEIGDQHTGSWETWDGRRGDVARAQLYLDVRYEGGIHAPTGTAEPDLILTDDPDEIVPTGPGASEGRMGIRSELLAWHGEDPVDDLDRARNEIVFLYQRNRNPFIDHPEWPACVFQDVCPIFADGFESGDVSRWSLVVE